MYPFIPLIITAKGRVGSDYDITKCPTNLNSYSPLAIAAIKGDLNQVNKLLPIELENPNSKKSRTLENILVDAARCGHKDIVKLALSYNPDLYTGDTWGGSVPILILSRSAEPQLLDLILKHGYNANFQYQNHYYPIFSAICLPARKENITILLRNGASQDVINKHGQTPLEYATACKDKEAIRRLQQDPNQPEEQPKPFSGWLN
jgi:ankyrin repeat protein